MTRRRALACGFSSEDADAIAGANATQDSQSHVWSSSAPEHGMPKSPWAAYVAEQLALARHLDGSGDRSGALVALGRATHAAQDAWSHDLRLPQGTMRRHILGYMLGRTGLVRNPDSPEQNPFEWAQAREATDDIMREFRRSELAGRKPPPCAP
jgi:hypothetical protein